MKEELKQELESLAGRLSIERFSAEEMLELLEDGEEVDWVVEQVLPAGSTAADELRALLQRAATAVAPPPAAEQEDEATGADDSDPSDASDGEDEEVDWDDLSDVELPQGVSPQQIKELMDSPRGALMADFGAFCEEKGFKPADDAGTEVNDSLRQYEEEWLDTPREKLEGKKPRELLDGGRLFPSKVETYRREQPKVGRNDPCSCGSGKKFKKCCGKAA